MSSLGTFWLRRVGFSAIGTLLAIVAFLTWNVSQAQASTLYLSPAAGTYSVGAYFPVSVYVSSTDKAINAISNKITFPTDKMQVTSLSKGGTIMNLWVQEPSFSNDLGSVDLAGVILNPGFTGAGGKVLTVNFKVIGTGTAKVNMAEGSVLANDGNGTETLGSMSGAQFSFIPAIQQPKAPPAPEPVIVPSPKPVLTELDAPLIKKYTDTVSPTDTILVEGTTQPDFMVRLYIENPGNRIKVAEARADDNGAFDVTWDQKLAGSQSQTSMYYMRLDATNSDGSRTTKMTNVLPVTVVAGRSLSQAVLLMIALGLSILVIIILIIALILALGKKRDEDKDNVREDVKNVEGLVHSTFDNMRKNLDYYTEVVETTSENRQLSKADEIIVKRMERNIDEAEKTIEGSVDKIGERKK